MKSAAAAMILAASLSIPATAHADCGDPGQDPCTGPVPTVEQVVDIMDEGSLTTPFPLRTRRTSSNQRSARTKSETSTINCGDCMLVGCAGRISARFIVTDIQPAPNNFAGATLAVPSGRRSTPPGPIVLVEQHGHWLITHDTATVALDAFDYNATRYIMKGKGPWC